MKKSFTLLAAALLSVAAHAVSVNVEQAGTLQSLLGDDYLNITELTVAGPLNGSDILTIREMAGVDAYCLETGGQLTTLDMTDASIVSGGAAYFYYANVVPRTTAADQIGMLMFKNTLLVNVTLPATVTTIGRFAFEGCMALQTVTIPGNTLVNIEAGAFNFCTALRKVQLAESLTKVDEQIFEGCKALEECNIPVSLVRVGDNMFADCVALRRIVIPEGVRAIGAMAFNNCLGLEEVSIPSTVVSLGARSFFNCSALKVIYNYSDTPATIDDEDVFTYVNDETCTLYVPLGSEQIYSVSQGWSRFLDIRPLSDVVTAIGLNTASDRAARAFNMAGQPVSQQAKGLVIVNGKKLFNRR